MERRWERRMRLGDGELDGPEAARVRAEIEADPDERGRLEAARALGAAVRAVAERAADEADLEGLWGRIEGRLEGATPAAAGRGRAPGAASSRRPRLVAWAAAGALLAAAAALALWARAPVEPGGVAAGTLPSPPSIEFASTPGTVFEVPDPDTGGTMTVVWLAPSDAEPGGSL